MKIILFVMNAPVHSEELPTTNPVLWLSCRWFSKLLHGAVALEQKIHIPYLTKKMYFCNFCIFVCYFEIFEYQ